MERIPEMTEDDFNVVNIGDALSNQIATNINAFKTRKWRNNRTRQEVAMRLNEASKIIDPDNHKFLSPETSERTGLEINPLWQMELLVRSGLLTPKEQVAALSKLAEYTHSKAPTLTHVNNTEMSHEDWLLTLAKDEYKTIDEVAPEVTTPVQVRERGFGPEYHKRRAKRLENYTQAQDYSDAEYVDMADQLPEDYDLESFFNGSDGNG